jgi:TolA-binding protein
MNRPTTLTVLIAAICAFIPESSAQPTTQPPAAATTPVQPLPRTRETRFSRSAEGEIRFQQGLLRYNSGQLALAEADFRGLVTDDPADSEAWYFLGLSQLDQQRPGDAVESFDQSIRLDPAPYEVHAARARSLIQLNRFDEAAKELDHLKGNPDFRGLEQYLRGQMLYQQGDLEGAAAAFAASRAAGGTEAAPAGFYEGLTYIRMRQLVRARQSFREGSSGQDRDPTLAAASEQLDAVLTLQEKPARPWEAQITLSYEYDTNVLQIGTNVPDPAGISGQEDSRIVLTPRGSYSFLRNERIDVGVEGSGYFAWQFDLHDFDIASYQAGPYANYKIRDNLYASARYAYNYVEFGHEKFLQRHVITPQLTAIQKDFGYTSAFYQFQTREFEDAPATPELERDGTSHTVGILQGINLPSIFRDAGPANLEVGLRYERQLADGSDFDAHFYSGGATLYTPLPWWKLRADVGLNLEYDDYDNGNSLDADLDTRRDFEINFVAGLSRQITKDIAVRMDYTYTDNDSNVETVLDSAPYEYDRHQFGVRLTYTF